jgi:hypothetical protein
MIGRVFFQFIDIKISQIYTRKTKKSSKLSQLFSPKKELVLMD